LGKVRDFGQRVITDENGDSSGATTPAEPAQAVQVQAAQDQRPAWERRRPAHQGWQDRNVEVRGPVKRKFEEEEVVKVSCDPG
jgi:hypothetical protein